MKNQRICPFTDFGFKLIFGRDSTKEFTIDFLNCISSCEKLSDEYCF